MPIFVDADVDVDVDDVDAVLVHTLYYVGPRLDDPMKKQKPTGTVKGPRPKRVLMADGSSFIESSE
jgi:hypothetical protein